MSFLDKVPLTTLLLVAVLLGMAPFMAEPHLWQKIKMLFEGELTKGIDIFDLIMHGTPSVLVLIKLYRMSANKSKSGA